MDDFSIEFGGARGFSSVPVTANSHMSQYLALCNILYHIQVTFQEVFNNAKLRQARHIFHQDVGCMGQLGCILYYTQGSWISMTINSIPM